MAEDKFVSDHKIETYKSMITISIEYYKALLLLNGAAAAGIVASIDKLVKVVEIDNIRGALVLFVIGLGTDAFAIFTAWFVQIRLHNENIGAMRRGSHTRLVGVAVVLVTVSLAAFCGGAMTAAVGIRSPLPTSSASELDHATPQIAPPTTPPPPAAPKPA